MLRLWPEEIYIGLFNDHCWSRRGRTGAVHNHAGNPPDSSAGQLQTLAGVLDDPENQFQPRSEVTLTVSDTLAAVASMPWQDGLSKPAELRRYAEVIFEKNGVAVGDDWAIRAEYTAFASLGIAYAFPHAWMNEVVQMLHQRSLRLKRVLPASAAAFYMPLKRAKRGRNLFLLQEARRASALMFVDGRLTDFDVEPVTLPRDQAISRLLRRTRIAHGEPTTVMEWSTSPERANSLEHLLRTELPAADHVSIVREALGSS